MNLLTSEEASRELRISLTSLYRLTKSGEIPHLRVGNNLRYQSDVLLDYMRRKATETVKVPAGS